ncbi:odorant receptor 67d-like [Sitodiplosis mosellana]|uniref:odorant receptor 67d-like n=1 Tax=Sitodiplosis mosellana TaxID=263140 RepID=UPI0024447B30|nr:odorant receptor 67d-like [Sitodiplosis mosellana]
MDTANVFSPLIVVQLVCSMLLMACTIFQTGLRVKQIDPDIAILVSVVLIGFSTLFLYCYLGKVATESFEKMANYLYYEVNWHELPIELQRYFILMIANIQKPLYYHGFSIITLKLETFCKFIQYVYSFNMMFKTLTSDKYSN